MLIRDVKKIVLKHVIGVITGLVPKTFDGISTEITPDAIVSAGKKTAGKIPIGKLGGVFTLREKGFRFRIFIMGKADAAGDIKVSRSGTGFHLAVLL